MSRWVWVVLLLAVAVYGWIDRRAARARRGLKLVAVNRSGAPGRGPAHQRRRQRCAFPHCRTGPRRNVCCSATGTARSSSWQLRGGDARTELAGRAASVHGPIRPAPPVRVWSAGAAWSGGRADATVAPPEALSGGAERRAATSRGATRSGTTSLLTPAREQARQRILPVVVFGNSLVAHDDALHALVRRERIASGSPPRLGARAPRTRRRRAALRASEALERHAGSG